MKQHKGKIATGIAVAGVTTALILSTTDTAKESIAPVDSALVYATDLAKQFEGLRLEPYRDAVGYPTVGYGHLLSEDATIDLTAFMSVTEAQADSLLAVDMSFALSVVDSFVTAPLTLYERAALADFVFNEGMGNFERSTLLSYLNEGLKDSIPNQLLRWEYAGGEIEHGLERRRIAERHLWLRGN